MRSSPRPTAPPWSSRRPPAAPSSRAGRSARRDHDRRGDPTTHPEPAGHRDRSRRNRAHQVVADLVRDGLVERTFVAVAPQVELQALQLHAQLAWYVIDRDRCEVGLTRDRTQAGELGALELDVVLAAC